MVPEISSWPDAEALACEHMREQLGIDGARLTNPGADGGVDVVSASDVAQVKFEKTPTGRPAVQRLKGEATARGVRGLFYSLSGYTSHALKFGNETGLALFQFNRDGEVSPVNGLAGQLVVGARNAPVRSTEEDGSQRNAALKVASWPFRNGRWYFYIGLLSWGMLAFVPFAHAAIRLHRRSVAVLAVLYAMLPVGLCVGVSFLPETSKNQVAEPGMSILMWSIFGLAALGCVVLVRIRRAVYQRALGDELRWSW
ncbi:MAG TPA: restriction endonuclease [Stackebrandtia sp.]|jgi:hypothetical protein|uniref:restriction endonuclease n=1 Tax=Stackebrandtia sp. TaxID=2023065 RepID=UPI002D61462E|nr:restriction endonuclease [Stackebrandtia sp.]HZE40976.1 restriction endonuclease [Stackebrandtia sp.]